MTIGRAHHVYRRNTRQRQVVLEELRKLHSHPTAAEIFGLARRRLPNISLGTVYRNLELLAQSGVIRKLPTLGGETRFDSDLSDHLHVRCTACNRVDDAAGIPPGVTPLAVKYLNGYVITGYHLEFEGLCPDCRARGTSGGESAKVRGNG